MGRQNIQEMWLKGKAALDLGLQEWGLFGAITLATLIAFALGRLSVQIEAKPLVEVRRNEAAAGSMITPGGQYVASRNGQTYYFPWCAGAAKIAPQNQRWFQTEDAAKKAGYRPAKNCKGLE